MTMFMWLTCILVHYLLDTWKVSLISVEFQVFGLGNKTYEHYNATAKMVDQKLEEMGASRIYDYGEGDDDANMEDDFITWKDSMWPKV